MKKKGKYAKKTPFVKSLAAVVAVVLLVGCAIGGTLAWLTDKTDAVTNTFTTSDIKIRLDETNVDNTTTGPIRDTENSYKMIPGWTIDKDPRVTVFANSEDCWLFVEITESDKFGDYITYAIASGWTRGEGEGDNKNGVPENVIFQKVTNITANKDFGIIGYTDTKGTVETTDDEFVADKVLVKDTVTKEMMNGLTADTYPKLTFTAYAAQLYKSNGVEFTASEAWALVNS